MFREPLKKALIQITIVIPLGLILGLIVDHYSK